MNEPPVFPQTVWAWPKAKCSPGASSSLGLGTHEEAAAGALLPCGRFLPRQEGGEVTAPPHPAGGPGRRHVTLVEACGAADPGKGGG